MTRDRRLEDRHEAFIRAALRLFIEKGFDDTSLADVVAEAGGSLATLYKLFGNKAGLLSAVVLGRVESGSEMIERIAAEETDPKTALLRLGQEMRGRYLDEEGVALSRVVIGYSLKDPEFASNFGREKFLRSQDTLTALFARWRDQGVEFIGEPRALAAMFIGMFVHELHSDAISHGTLAPYEFRDIDYKIAFFCRGAGLDC